MTRERKFRAWSENHKRFGYFHLHPNSITFPSSEYFGNQAGSEAVIFNGIDDNWQEFTGLKDKNGKEIYVGDLLKVSVMTRSLESVHPDHHYEQNFVDEVKFQHGYFYCKYFLWEIAANAEIVGNIHKKSHGGFQEIELTTKK